MHQTLYYTHLISVSLFLLLYTARTVFLLTNKPKGLQTLMRYTAIPERLFSVLFLLTGIYLLTQVSQVNTLMTVKLLCVIGAIVLGVVANKKQLKSLAVLSLVLVVGAFGLASASNRQTARGTLSDNIGKDGKEIFIQACSQCHGTDGKKSLMVATDLSTSTLNAHEISSVIKNGRGRMPAYQDVLNEEQLRAVTSYVNELRR